MRAASRSPTSFSKVAIVFLILLGVGLALGFAVYERFVSYQTTIARHLPSDAPVLLRLDLTHVLFHEPFRRVWLELVDELPKRPESRGRTERLRAQGVDLSADIREIGVALGPEPGGWTLVLGGRLKPGIGKVLANTLEQQEGLTVQLGGSALGQNARSSTFQVPSAGVAFAETPDGTLIIASSVARLEAVLEPKSSAPELSRGAGGLVVSSPPLPPSMQWVRGSFRAGSVLAFTGEVSFDPTSPESTREEAWESLKRAIQAAAGSANSAELEAELSSNGGATRAISVRLPREAVLGLAKRARAVILR